MCHQPALQRSSFSFPMGSGGAGGGQQHPHCGFCLANLLPAAAGPVFTHLPARLCSAGIIFLMLVKCHFFFSKSPSSTSLSGRTDPWHPGSPYGILTFLPAWLFLGFSCIMEASGTRAFLFPLLQLSTLPVTANLQEACQLFAANPYENLAPA